jgi:hypothetical protein
MSKRESVEGREVGLRTSALSGPVAVWPVCRSLSLKAAALGLDSLSPPSLGLYPTTGDP